MRRRRRIAIVGMQRWGYSRGILRGIMQYAKPLKPWIFRLVQLEAQPVAESLAWKPDGVIGFLDDPKSAEWLGPATCPIINVSNSEFPSPQVGVEDSEVGKLAALHFLERGFRNFVYYGFRDKPWSVGREQGFFEALASAGFCASSTRSASQEDTFVSWHRQMDVRKRLAASPKPLAVFCASDEFSWELSETCHALGIAVPEDVGVLGVDNDEFFCGMAHPQLSSVRLPLERVGYEAARLLDRLMRGMRPPKKPVLLPPVNVVTRQSSDVIAVRDPDVSQALRYIRENATRSIKISEMMKQLNISRRTFETKFRKIVGRSPLQEIHAMQMNQARDLLVSTDMPMAEIARACGLSTRQFWSVFKKAARIPPTDYRLQFGRNRLASAFENDEASNAENKR